MENQFYLGFAVGAGSVLILLVVARLGFGVMRPWVRIKLCGGRGTLLHIIAMRFRGTPPRLIVDAYTSLLHSGVQVRLMEVESQYVAHRATIMDARDLIEHVREYKQRETIARQRHDEKKEN